MVDIGEASKGNIGNEDFYKLVLNLSAIYQKSIDVNSEQIQLIELEPEEQIIERILRQDSEAILKLILKKYRRNIKLAAMSGFREAHIFICTKTSKLHEIVPIYDMIEPPDKIKQKIIEFNLEPITNTLQKLLSPFILNIRPLTTISEFDFLQNHLNYNDDIIIVSVSWN